MAGWLVGGAVVALVGGTLLVVVCGARLGAHQQDDHVALDRAEEERRSW